MCKHECLKKTRISYFTDRNKFHRMINCQKIVTINFWIVGVLSNVSHFGGVAEVSFSPVSIVCPFSPVVHVTFSILALSWLAWHLFTNKFEG